MKTYRFRLERIRALRRAEEVVARNALGVANRRLGQAIAERDQRRERYVSLPRFTGVMERDSFMRNQGELNLAAASLAAGEQAVATAVSESAARQLDWVFARRKVKALDRMDKRAKEAYLVELGRLEVKEVDDIVSACYAVEGLGYVTAEVRQVAANGYVKGARIGSRGR